MINRVLPEPEKFSACPHDGKILEFYDGQFDSVYVLLHPFFKPKAIDINQFNPSTWPSKCQIIAGCTPISWQEVIERTGLESIAEIDVGLRTSIGGLKKEFSNQSIADRLDDLANEDNIIHPQEGDLPPLLENRLFVAIQSLGYEWLWVGDELGTERKLYWIDDLKNNDEIPSHGCVFTHDHKILITTHWDSHCSFLCSSKDTIDKILGFDQFEGFYCTSHTEVFWSTYETQKYNK